MAAQPVPSKRGDVDERRELEALRSVTDAILANLELEDLLHELLVRVRQILAVDTAAILMRDGDDLTARAAVGLEEEVQAKVRVPIGQGFAGRVAADGRPVRLDNVTPTTVINPILLQKKLRTMLGVPLVARGSIIGVLHVGTRQPRRFKPRESRLLQLVADRSALAIENAQLIEAERRRTASLNALSEVVTAIHAAVRIEEVMQAIADVAQRLAGGAQAIAAFFRGRGEPQPTEFSQWAVAGAPRAAFEHLGHLHMTPLFGPTFQGLGTVRSDDVTAHPLFRGLPADHVPVRSYLAVPVMARTGQVLGVILVGHVERKRFDDEVQRHVESLARHAAFALENALLYERQRTTAETLQRSLLPQQFPSFPGTTVAASYLPGGAEAEVGGDWYDVLALDRDRIGLAIGDVVGRGVPAAAAMSQLRNSLAAYAVLGITPGVLATRLSRVARQLPSTHMATCIYAVLDTSKWTLTYTNAGHPPALFIGPGGEVKWLDAAGSVPLGIEIALSRPETTVPFPPGSTVVLYTDGLIEARGHPLEKRLRQLEESAAGAAREPVDRLVDILLKQMLPTGPGADDVAIVSVRAISLGQQPLQLDLQAVPDSLAAMRQAVRRWLRDSNVPADEAFKILTAVGEAAANAIEHAYGPDEATFQVTGTITSDRVAFTIRDHGKWRPARGERRGKGFLLMRSLMDVVEIEQAAEGTTVRLSHRLGRSGPP